MSYINNKKITKMLQSINWTKKESALLVSWLCILITFKMYGSWSLHLIYPTGEPRDASQFIGLLILFLFFFDFWLKVGRRAVDGYTFFRQWIRVRKGKMS